MNRKNLTAAVLAGLAGAAGIVGSAQAVNINPDGLGQVLIYPYYTTNGGNSTILSVVNTTENAKAVKVRFTEGQNTREVLDFNLYMSAYDVWAAAIIDDAGTPTLVVNDTTCTVPYLYMNDANGDGTRDGMQEFLPFGLIDGGSTDISRTAEGHFEMIEMGTMIDELDKGGAALYGSAWAATHSSGTPNDCQQLVDAWTDPDNTVVGDEGYWLQDPFIDLTAPSGGLFGGAAIINVDDGTMFSYDAKAINGFANTVDANDVLHQVPGDIFPSLNSGNIVDGTVFLENGTTYTSGTMARGVDAVSFVFMHDQIMNEYTTESMIGGASEWVVTFPTKSFYVYSPVSGSAVPVAPFTTMWNYDAENSTLGLPCEVVVLDSIWDREERTIVNPDIPGEPVPPIVSPAPPPVDNPVDPIIPFELCYETSVIAFGPDLAGAPTPVLGSTNAHSIDNTALGFEFGWARLQLDDYPNDANGDGTIDPGEAALTRTPLGGLNAGLNGLPVTGFAVERFQNGFLGDGAAVLANYGGTFQHKSTRKPGSGITSLP